MLRALLAALAFVAFVYAMLSVAPSELAARPRDTFTLFLPVVTRGPNTDPRKGVAGFTFAPTVTSTRSYRQMG